MTQVNRRRVKHGASPRIPRRRFGLVFGMLTGLNLICGCGDKRGVERTAVKGEVTLDGRPVEFACVQFIPAGDARGPRATARVTNGQYELPVAEGPVIGPLRVEICTDFGRMHPGEGPEQLAKRYQGLPPEPIPPHYNRESTLQVTTVAGRDNTFSFELLSKPSQ